MSDASLSTLHTLYDELFRFNTDLAEVSREVDELLNMSRSVLDRNTRINPGDYIDDASAYDAWVQSLVEEDGGGRRGAPPAARSAVEALETFEVGSSEMMMNKDCAVCKDAMVMGEIGKKLPCGHCYHGDCILPWLATRNSCPLCRFQLQTDDPEYERRRVED